MVKKIGFLLLSLLVILGFGVSFANPIAVDISTTCDRLKNSQIDNYIAVITTDRDNRGYFEYYIPEINQTIKILEGIARKNPLGGQGREEVWLLDKTINTNIITEDIINNNAIFIGYIWGQDISSESDCDEIKTYEIINSGDTYKLVEVKTLTKNFPYARLITIVTEIIILLAIAKLFRKEDQISNRKLILFGILPTTITLPLLRFVLPLLIGEGLWYTIIGEVLVIIVEAIIIKYGLKISRGKAILASMICNIASYGVGLLIL